MGINLAFFALFGIAGHDGTVDIFAVAINLERLPEQLDGLPEITAGLSSANPMSASRYSSPKFSRYGVNHS